MALLDDHALSSLTVSAEGASRRLDRYVLLSFPQASLGLIAKLVRKGALRLNGKRTQISTRLQAGDQISIPKSLQSLEASPKTQVRPKSQGLSDKDRQLVENMILDEGEDCLILNKPAGLAVQGGSKTYQHLDHLLGQYYSLQGAGVVPKLVHRLDKETSGVMMVAKTTEMARWLTKAFKDKKVQKSYIALLEGEWDHPNKGTIDIPIVKKDHGPRGEFMVGDPINGMQAITKYEVIETVPGFTYIRLFPLTGRTHQLRVHMKDMGYAILGDDKYSTTRAFFREHGVEHRLYLHAESIEAPMPDGLAITQTTGAPQAFQILLSYLGFESLKACPLPN